MVLIEDDAMIVEMVKEHLFSQYEIQTFDSSEAYLSFLKQNVKVPDVIVLDYYLPNMSGLELYIEIKDRFQGTKFIALSSATDARLVLEIVKAGIKEYVIKDECFLKGLTLALEDRYNEYLDLTNND